MTDTKKMNINEAFCAAQSEIGVARKNTSNPFFNSKYADLKECFNACSDALNRHGIHISQPTMLEGDLFVIRTILTHTSGETMQDFGVPIVGWKDAKTKNPAQAFGSGQTYARRYGLCGMVGIAPADDDAQSLTQDKPKAATQVITENQAKEIAFLIDSKGVDQDVFMKYYKVSTLSELPASKFASAVESLNKKDDV
jgi:hypothetical protein